MWLWVELTKGSAGLGYVAIGELLLFQTQWKPFVKTRIRVFKKHFLVRSHIDWVTIPRARLYKKSRSFLNLLIILFIFFLRLVIFDQASETERNKSYAESVRRVLRKRPQHGDRSVVSNKSSIRPPSRQPARPSRQPARPRRRPEQPVGHHNNALCWPPTFRPIFKRWIPLSSDTV